MWEKSYLVIISPNVGEIISGHYYSMWEKSYLVIISPNVGEIISSHY